MVTSLLLLARRSAAEAEQRVRGELLDDLLDAATATRACCASARPGWTPTSTPPTWCSAARLDGHRRPTRTRRRPPADSLWAAASHLAATRHGLAAARDGGTVLLLPLRARTTPRLRSSARRTAAAARAPAVARAGHRRRLRAGPRLAAHPDAVAAAYPEARRCLDALRLLGRAGEGAAAEDFGFLGLLLADSRDIGGLRRPHHRPGRRLRRAARHRPGRTMDAYFALRDEPRPHQGRAARPRQHRRPAPGAGGPAARRGLAGPAPRAGDPARAAAAPVVGRARQPDPARGAPGPGARGRPVHRSCASAAGSRLRARPSAPTSPGRGAGSPWRTATATTVSSAAAITYREIGVELS